MKPVRGLKRSAACTLAAAYTVLALVPAAAAGGPRNGATYRGKTSKPENNPVSFKVANNGKHVLDFTTRLGYDGKCGQGGGPNYNVHASSIALSHSGSFTAVVPATLGPFKAKVKISGHVKGRKASGVVEQTPPNICNTPPNVGAKAYQETFTASVK